MVLLWQRVSVQEVDRCVYRCYTGPMSKYANFGNKNGNWKGGKSKYLCFYCRKVVFRYRSTVRNEKRVFCSVLCNNRQLAREKDQWGDKNPQWKGDDVGYYGVHRWVESRKGKPSRCEMCGETTGKFEWANTDHRYARDLKDWLRLCVACHKTLDKDSRKRDKETGRFK